MEKRRARLFKRSLGDPVYYLTNTGSGYSSLWKLLETAPSIADDTTIVIFPKDSTGYMKVIPGTENSTVLTSFPTSFDGYGWRTDQPLSNGRFVPDTWYFYVTLVTGKYVTGDLKVYVRLWKSSNSDGSGAVALTSWMLIASVSSPTSETVYNLSGSVDLSELSFSDEYLFIEFLLETTIGCTASQGCQVTFKCNEGNNQRVVTPPYFLVIDRILSSGYSGIGVVKKTLRAKYLVEERIPEQFYYRKAHIIEGSESYPLTDYQIRIIVHYGSGTDNGEHVYLNERCRTDFGDIRFTSSDGETPLSYWMEKKVDGDYAVFWVKVPFIPASPNTVTIYIYYGNENATTTSDPDSTLELYDPCESLEGWTLRVSAPGYTASVDSSHGHPPPCFIISGDNWAEDYNQFIYKTINKPEGVGLRIIVDHEGYHGWYTEAFTMIFFYTTDNVLIKAINLDGHINDWYYNREVREIADIANYTSLWVGFGLRDAWQADWHQHARFDNIRIMKYVESEPIHGVWGPEESKSKKRKLFETLRKEFTVLRRSFY